MKRVHVFKNGDLAISDTPPSVTVQIQTITLDGKQRDVSKELKVTDEEYSEFKKNKITKGKKQDMLTAIINRGE